MPLVLVIDIHGEIDQSGLERLRSSLDLAQQGRLTDDWDQEFGHRRIDTANGTRFRIGLLRNFDGSWKIQVVESIRSETVSDEFAQLRKRLLDGIKSAGYRAAVRDKPSFGSAP